MDWGQLLVLFILLGLPLLEFIERILTQRRGKGAPPPPPPDRERVEPRTEEAITPDRTDADGWAIEWPAPSPEVDTSHVGTEVETLDADWQAGATAAEYVPEAVHAATTVVSLEPLEVDRTVEHARFHREIRQTEAPSVRHAPPRLAARLRSREDLRNAIVLAEVLGPPRGGR